MRGWKCEVAFAATAVVRRRMTDGRTRCFAVLMTDAPICPVWCSTRVPSRTNNREIKHMTPDDFNKVVLASVALVTTITGPSVGWLIVRHQTKVQAEIAKRAAIDNVSAKRQHWIDGLRDDVAELIAQTTLLASLRRTFFIEKSDEKKAAIQDLSRAAYEKAEVCIVRTELRLNPTETKHQEFMRLLRQFDATSKKFFTPHDINIEDIADTFDKQRAALVAKMQSILKEEWNRVRDGRI